MTKNDLSFEDKVEMIASLIGDNFLRVARALREIQDDKPEIFLEIAKRLGISRRRAYALARIDRQFAELGVAEERLCSVGWSKLQVIGRHLNAENAEYLLQLKNARVMTLYFDPADYGRLRTALLAHGAVPNGNGLIEKETALMKLIDKVGLA